jgi:short-subunit dehydrogenase
MKKAIVIGATSGIGKELARLLVTKDYTVGITGRRISLLQELRKENPGKYIIEPFDISNAFENPEHLQILVNELGGLDLLIINSGTGNSNEDLDFKIEKETIDTNVSGVTEIADWAFNYFRKQGNGHFAVISSIAGLRGSRFAPAYSASKAYQINYFEGLRQKAKHLKLKVTITDIRPGFVDTAMMKSKNLFWVETPQKAAEQIYHALKKKKRIAYITGRWILIAYIMKLLPKWIFERI